MKKYRGMDTLEKASLANLFELLLIQHNNLLIHIYYNQALKRVSLQSVTKLKKNLIFDQKIMPCMFISHNKAKYALISDLTRPGPA